MESSTTENGATLTTENHDTTNQAANNTDQETEDQRDYPQLQETGYTKDGFKDLTVAGRSEIIIRALLQTQPANLDTICQHIFQNDTEPPIYAVRHFLENYWDKIIYHENGIYCVAHGIQYDPGTPSIYKLWSARRNEEVFRCTDCGETYKKSRDARKHRQEQGHLNWGFQKGGGNLLNTWEKNSRKQRAETA